MTMLPVSQCLFSDRWQLWAEGRGLTSGLALLEYLGSASKAHSMRAGSGSLMSISRPWRSQPCQDTGQ